MRSVSASLVPLDTFAPANAERFVEWARTQRHETSLDPAVIGYPRTCMLTATDDDVLIGAIPVHPVLMLESFLHAPGLTRGQLAIALLRIHEMVTRVMRSTGMHEAYFLTRRADLALLAVKHGGWTECLHDPARETWLMKLTLLDNKCT